MPQLAQLHTYKAGPIEQIAMPGETVGLWVNKVYEFYKVSFVEGIMRSDPVALTIADPGAGGASAVTQLTILQMPDLEFTQCRAEVLDDAQVILYQGRADQRHKLQNVVATFGRMNREFDPDAHLTEFYEFENNFAFVQAFNNTDYALPFIRIVFWGFRYVLEALPDFSWKHQRLPDVWTRVPCTAHL